MTFLYPVQNTSFQWYIETNDEYVMHPSYSTFYWGNVRYGISQMSDVIWPRSRMIGGSTTTDYPVTLDTAAYYGQYYYTWVFRAGGSGERKIITGLTLTANTTSYLANVTVNLFNVANNQFLDTDVSDASGYYMLGTPYTTNVYCVAYKSGSPDVAGTTTNVLVPT